MDKVLNKIRITENGCWEFTGSKTPSGYGKIGRRINGKLFMYQVHRYVYESLVGKIDVGMQANHHCDNRVCCNPKHIFIGTQKDNMEDAYSKGRMPRDPHEHKNWKHGQANQKGEHNGNSKIDEETAKYIRHLYNCEIQNQVTISKFVGISRTQVGRIVRKEHWKNSKHGSLSCV